MVMSQSEQSVSTEKAAHTIKADIQKCIGQVPRRPMAMQMQTSKMTQLTPTDADRVKRKCLMATRS